MKCNIKLKKVAIVIQSFMLRNGTERAVTNLANILVALGYDVTVVSLIKTDICEPSYVINPAVKISFFKLDQPRNFFDALKFYWTFVCKIRNFIIENNIDCIIGTRCQYNYLLRLFLTNCKVIAWEHFNYMAAGIVHRINRRLLYPFCDKVVVLTERDAQRYSFVRKNRLTVIPNSFSFETDDISNVTSHKIISLGRLSPQKGYDQLLQAAVKIKSQLPDWTLDIYGSGEEEEVLFNLRKKLDLESFVNFYPPTPQVKENLCSSGIYVMSSRFEGLPMTLIEAQVCGLPIVSFDCDCGPSDIVKDGVNGFLIPPGDLDGFADAVVKLGKDEDLRRQFGAAAKESCKRFSAERVSVLWKSLMDSL